jgi:hypothetical protein
MAPASWTEEKLCARAWTARTCPAQASRTTEPPTKALYDVVMAITGCPQTHFTQSFFSACHRMRPGGLSNNSLSKTLTDARLTQQFPETCASDVKGAKLRINGSGRKTPVADAATLIEVAFSLPGNKAHDFRRAGADKVCEALGGDVSLLDEPCCQLLTDKHQQTKRQEYFWSKTWTARTSPARVQAVNHMRHLNQV